MVCQLVVVVIGVAVWLVCFDVESRGHYCLRLGWLVARTSVSIFECFCVGFVVVEVGVACLNIFGSGSSGDVVAGRLD